MVLYARWLGGDLARFKQLTSKRAMHCRQLTKAVLRAVFELVMEREGQYTPDLYWCYRAFAKWYPEYAGAMYAALECYLQPNPADKERRLQVIRLRKWLDAEFQLRQLAGG